MILDIPLLTASPPDSGTPPSFFISGDRFGQLYSLNDSSIFYGILPNTYLGNSLNIKVWWSFPATPSGSQSATWGASFEKLDVGAIITSYNFTTERTVTTSASTVALTLTTINLSVSDLTTILSNTLFRLKIKLTAKSGPSPVLLNLAIDNGS